MHRFTEKKYSLIIMVIMAIMCICFMQNNCITTVYAEEVSENVQISGDTRRNEAKKGIVQVVSGLNDERNSFHQIHQSTGFLALNEENGACVIVPYDSLHLTDSDIRTFCKETGTDEDRLYSRDPILKVIVENGGDETLAGEVRTNETRNYYILHFGSKIGNYEALSLGYTEGLFEDAPVYSLGFPKGLMNSSTAVYDSEHVVIESGNAKSFTDIGGNRYIRHDTSLDEGLLGGPILDEDGYVIGMNTTSSGGKNYALSIDLIRNSLDLYNIPYAKKEVDEARLSLNEQIAECRKLISGGKYKKQSTTALQELLSQAEEISADQESGESELIEMRNNLVSAGSQLIPKMDIRRKLMIILGFIIGFLSVRLVRLLMFFRRKQKSDKAFSEKNKEQNINLSVHFDNELKINQSTYMDATIKQTPAAKQGGISLIHNLSGKKEYYDKDQITIGRMKGQVDFCLDNKAVGRFHALIKKENDDYILYDNSSVNGSFVEGNRVGDAGYLLHDGDIITLAGEDIIFHKGMK